MEPSCVLEPRDATIQKLYEEHANLKAQIDRLQVQADSAQGGIRLYRNHRVDQFRERERDLTTRLVRVEASPVDSFSADEARSLIDDLKETVSLAAHTFYQVASLTPTSTSESN